jgi:hypothetical protein
VPPLVSLSELSFPVPSGCVLRDLILFVGWLDEDLDFTVKLDVSDAALYPFADA